MKRSWRDVSPGEVDEAVERLQEKALARFEAEQERLEAEDEAGRAWVENGREREGEGL